MSGQKKPASPTPKKPNAPTQHKVFDIRRPGKAIASPTSRPVITPPKVKDSVLVEKPQTSKHSRIADDPDEKRDLMDSTKKVMIQPPESAPTSNVPVANDTKPAPEPEITPTPQPPAPSPQPNEVNTKVPTSIEELLQNSGDQQLPPSITAETDTPPQAPMPPVQQPAPEPVLPQTEAEPHDPEEVLASTAPPEVDMSRAVISTHVTPRRHLWREVLIFVGLLLFVVAAFDILLDAGVLHVHGVPHTNLFTKGN